MKTHTFKCTGCGKEATRSNLSWHDAWTNMKYTGWRCSKIDEKWHQWCPSCPIRDNLKPSEEERKQHATAVEA